MADVLEKLLAEARKRKPFEVAVPVAVGDVAVEVVVRQLMPAPGWRELVAEHPPRDGVRRDVNVGFDAEGVAEVYPVAALSVDGESVSSESWSELWGVLDSVGREDLAVAVWAVNERMPQVRLEELVRQREQDSEG